MMYYMVVEDVSNAYTSSIFMVEVCEFVCVYRILLQRTTKMGSESGEWCPIFWAGGTVNRESCTAGPCKGREVHQKTGSFPGPLSLFSQMAPISHFSFPRAVFLKHIYIYTYLTLQPRRWRKYVLPKHRQHCPHSHGENPRN